jgi:glucosamine--fructose-6-phosphate aminotransferase (isomerizing)
VNPASVMHREIREQPATIASTIDALLPLRSQLRRLASGCRSVTLFARGSSDTAAVYGRYLLEIRANLPASLGAPSIATLYGAAPDLRDTLVVVLSQSGQTDELIEVATWAHDCGARTIAVTNGSDSPLAHSVDIALVTTAGPELAVPATKTYTAQLAALGVLGAALADDADDLVDGLEAAGGEAQRLLADISAAEAVAAAIADAAAFVVAGRGYTLSSALEIALKAQEVCGIPALGLSGADLQHGPSALERRDVPLIIAAPPSGPCLAALQSCAVTAAGRGAPVYCIGGDDRLRSLCDMAIPGPMLSEAIAPLVGVIPGQVLVEEIARLRGVDPDRPVGLTKVTQTAQ